VRGIRSTIVSVDGNVYEDIITGFEEAKTFITSNPRPSREPETWMERETLAELIITHYRDHLKPRDRVTLMLSNDMVDLLKIRRSLAAHIALISIEKQSETLYSILPYTAGSRYHQGNSRYRSMRRLGDVPSG
jgi:hypothetical protein